MIRLNAEENEVELGNGKVLKLLQHIDFKHDIEQKITVGKIMKFKYAGTYLTPTDNPSVWMYVTELENQKNKTWLSVATWLDNYNNGLFSSKSLAEASKLIVDESTEPADDDLPF